MDQQKIGRYLAEKRKGLGLTQRQLAEKLSMSDKSISKWERGICLPDVSVYTELCEHLGISLNEFLAGEDITQDCMIQKSEENIIGITTDSKHRQKCLKRIICLLSIISILALSIIGIFAYLENRPQNFIAPVPPDSIEMKTAELLSDSDGAHIYQYTTTDEYSSLKLYISEYHSGKLVDKQDLELGYEGIGSPKNGTILIVPDFKNFLVKIIAADNGSKLSAEIPILKDVPDREYYGRSSARIEGETGILYNVEQPLVGLIYDNDEMYVIDLYDMLSGETDSISKNDYMYLFSYEFHKE